MDAGPLGTGWDAGDAEEGSQEGDHKGHNDRTLNPEGGTRGHGGSGPRAHRPPAPSAALGLGQLVLSSRPTPHTSPGLGLEGGTGDPQGAFIRGWVKEQTLPSLGVSEGGRPWGRDAEPQRGGGRGLEWAATVLGTHGSQPVRGEKAPERQGCCEPWGPCLGNGTQQGECPQTSLDTPGSTKSPTHPGDQDTEAPRGKTRSPEPSGLRLGGTGGAAQRGG